MSATASATATPVAVPDIGDFGDVPIIELFVSPGATIAAEDPIATLESDKATMDVPSPVAGTVKEVLVKLGDKVSEGSPLITVEEAQPAPPAGVAAAPKPSSPPPAPQSMAPASALAPVHPAEARTNGDSPVYASPSVRRLARELGVNLQSVAGSGRKGRIVVDDVRSGGAQSGAAATTAGGAGIDLAPWPTVDFEKFGEVERVPRSRIQKLSGANLARNWVMIPHVTQNDEADITELEAWRKQLNAEHSRDGLKVTMVTFLIAASVATLKAFPNFNASLDGDDLVLKRYYNIGFAADTPQGLVVPVIKGADRKGILEIAGELTELSGKARDGKLSPGEMSGSTFTISSLGGIGGTSFTPIINAPEVAILGVTRATTKPVWDAESGAFTPRLMVPLSLSYDHRVIDGAAAARFVVHLARVLSDLRRALL